MSNLDWMHLRDADFSPLGEAAEQISAYAADWDGDIEQRLKDISILEGDGTDVFEGTVGDESRRQAERLEQAMRDDLESGWARTGKYLQDACDGLTEQQAALRELLENAPQYYLVPHGGVGDEHFLPELPEGQEIFYDNAGNTYDRTGYHMYCAEQAIGLTDEFQSIMTGAREIDDECATGLRAINSDSLGEQVPAIGEWDFERKSAEYDANTATELLQGGEDGTVDQEEINRLNDILAYQDGDPVFSTTLMNALGADGLVSGLSNIQAAVGDGDLPQGSLDTLYEGLGTALAVATDPASQPHVSEEWTEDFMVAGETMATNPASGETLRGYQTVMPLFLHGDYSEHFLVPVADHIMAVDAGSTPWPSPGEGSGLDDAGLGGNPVNYVLDAMDRNPQAALDFFSDTDRELEVDSAYPPVEDPFAYMMDRIESDYPGGDIAIDADQVGNALESATTRMESSTELSEEMATKPHDSKQAALTDRLMEFALDHENQFTDPGGPFNPMMDNLGDITANYMADIHHAMSNPDLDNAWLPDTNGIELSIAENGDHASAAQWLELIAHDERAMATAWAVSEGMLYGEIEAASNGDNWQADSTQAVLLHADITASLTAGALDEIGDRVDDGADAHNTNVDTIAKAVNFGVSLSGVDPLTGGASGELVNGIAKWAKTDGSELIDLTTQAQEAYQGQLESTIPYQAMEVNIEAILSEDPDRDTDEIDYVTNNYGHAYSGAVEDYLSGQYDGMERN